MWIEHSADTPGGLNLAADFSPGWQPRPAALPAATAETVHRIELTGALFLPLQLGTGVAMAWHKGVTWASLTEPGYGRTLAAKLGLFAVVMLAAAAHGWAHARGRAELARALAVTSLVGSLGASCSPPHYPLPDLIDVPPQGSWHHIMDIEQSVERAAVPPDAARPPSSRQRTLMLILATLGFALNFWAWALLSPLGTRFKDSLGLNSFQVSLLVAVPVIVGSLGRIPVGTLTDRYGGRVMLPLVSATTIIPVLYLGLAGHSSLSALLIGGFFLGIGGTSFAVGVPFVNAWFPPERRGMAIGVFGVGMGGTAISALTTVKLVKAHGLATPFVITAIALAVYAIVAFLLLRDAPGRQAPSEPLARRLGDTLRLGVTWQASALYAVVFGGYVAFSVYLPTYLKTAYGLQQADAANRMAGFVLLAVLMRPLGGWLSDRMGPVRVLSGSLAVVALGALVQSSTPALAPLGTAAFLTMAAALGAGSGATFALVALLAPANKVGSVTGVVGAAGGLGGFVPPLVMGALYGAFHTYAAGLAALTVVAAAALAFTATKVRRAVGA